MPGPLCLQGGGEFAPACAAMDRGWLSQAPPGPVVLLPLAAEPGGDYKAAGRRGVAHYAGLDTGRAVHVAPDSRRDLAAALAALREAAAVVVPGGAPGRLHDALLGAVADLLRDRWRDGAAISGASAGAMLLAGHTALPDRAGQPVVAGLGFVPDLLVLPHFRSVAAAPGWRPPAGHRVLGLPECTGVLVSDAGVAAVGVGVPLLWRAGSGDEAGSAVPVSSEPGPWPVAVTR